MIDATKIQVSKCGHTVIEGHGCFVTVMATLTRTEAENIPQPTKTPTNDWLVSKGFDPTQLMECEKNPFTGDSTFCQMLPVKCSYGKFVLKVPWTIQEVRQWMMRGCPT